MKILNRAYNHKEDYSRTMNFLRDLYRENGTTKGWMPQRFEDMEYRINTLYMEQGKPNWHPHIRLWEADGSIAGIAAGEDEDNLYPCIKNGYESIFMEMLDWKEGNLAGKDKTLTVAVQEGHNDYINELSKRGYEPHKVLTYNKSQLVTGGHEIRLPEGYSIISGNDTRDPESMIKKYRAVHLGFHPDDEGNPSYRNIEALSFWAREQAPMFDYTYEIMTKNRDGDICSYMYTWVDKETGTAYLEPVCTRKAHRRKGLVKAMTSATLNILAREGINKCFVDPYNDERNAVYSACGFETDSIEYWYRKRI